METFAATYYSDPSSSSVTLTGQATGGTATSSGWSTNAAGPFASVIIVQTDNIVIQQGSTVTTTTGSAQTVSNITFGTGTLGAVGSTLVGGTLVLAASSFNSQGNIAGTGVFTNATSNTTRISLTATNKTINASLTGSGGFTINANVLISLAGHTTIGGRISLTNGSSGNGTILNLATYNLTVDNLAMGSTLTKLTASGVESLTISTAAPATVLISQLYMDQTSPGTTNKLASLTVNLGASSSYTNGLVIGSSTISAPLIVGTLNLTSGKVLLNNSNLTVNSAITGGSSNSFIVTNNATANATGSLMFSVPAAVRTFIPCGTISSTNGSSYDNLAVTPSNATTLTIQIKNAFANAVADAAKVTSREFNIASSTPSSTFLEITPAFPPATTSSPVVGTYSSGWTETTANRNVNTWEANVTNFGFFGVGAAGGFLAIVPIKMLSFDASLKQHSVLLNWATASEKGNALFIIEKSINGKDFNGIGEVLGSGFTETISNYSFVDKNPTAGTSYYRIKQVDYNGTATYSDVKAIKIIGKDFILKSNIVQNNLQVIMSTQEETTLSILNTAGQQLMHVKARVSKVIDLSSLAPGVYILRSTNGTSANFIKQ